MEHVLDNPVWHALIGPQRVHAMGRGSARHYPRDMAPFSAIVEPSEAAYADLAVDLLPGTEARLFRMREEPLPSGWQQLDCFPMLQMVARGAPQHVSNAGALLSETDSWAMADLVEISRPGPFGSRTPRLGHYLGMRDGDRLLAMAGERMRLPGYVELSAICVHPEARGRGHAADLTSRLMRMAFDRGEVPFLHVRPDNAGAVALYRRLGFEMRRELVVTWRRPL
ncbi:MAG: GNAT family N-acetyltransferase [Reyranella sp.]|nr:GNAT family N-acetyltransferase [Reyranella sp.]